ncbi:MAG: biotin-dependent carboxyltransferase family protein [Candidatus Sericytochromatia bacterium]
MNALTVLKPGLLTTVQDAGRVGFQRYGMPVAGAMDPFAMAVANVLVGNPLGAAVLESTLVGPTLRAGSDMVLAVCGADVAPSVEGEPVGMWRSFRLPAGATLACQAAATGARAYLAVAGGFAVPMVMGSASTYLQGRLGGLEGRALRRGDVLPVGPAPEAAMPGRRLVPEAIPRYAETARLRVVPGPEAGGLDPVAWREPYVVTPQADRMGYRLSGPAIGHALGELLSDATPMGTIQVPPDGQPILLMADRQPTGGYPRLGVVASVDWPAAAQLRPGSRVSFEPVTVDEAVRRYREQAALLRTLLAGREADGRTMS